jgi:secreted trypsin-like serine protease
MRRAILLLATMALAILAASGVAQAIINGELDVGEDAHPYVGALVTEFEVAEGQFELVPVCSGTLISPTVFLTAGHCVEELVLDEDLPTYVSFDPTYELGESRLISGTPYMHPRYNTQFLLFDVGVVVLDEPYRTGAGYAKLPEAKRVDTLEKGTLLTAVGYGATDWDVGGGQPQPVYPDDRYRATVRYLGTSWDLGYIPRKLRDSWMKVRAGSMGEGGEGQCYGDSGGPYFLPDQRTVVGVTSFGLSPLCTGVAGVQRVDLPVVRKWVRSFL